MSRFDLPTADSILPQKATIQIERQAAYFMEQPIKDLFEASSAMVLVLNSERRIVFHNSELRLKLGLNESATAIGMRFGDLLHCIHAQESSCKCGSTEFCPKCGASQAIAASLDMEQQAVEECRSLRMRNSSLEALDLRIKAVPFEHDGERFVIVSAEDISDEKRRLALERIFFHDILNTAGAVRGMLQLMSERTPPGMTGEMHEIIRHMGTLIDEINGQRDLLAAESNQLTLSLGMVSSLQALQGVRSRYAGIEEPDRIVIAPESRDIFFETDLRLFTRVLGNLVKNAVEASGSKETVSLSATENGDEVEFSVLNPGAMPTEVKLQIFKRSFSTKGKGRGLGTYSVKLLVERYLGGKVSFESEPGTGTAFHITLPKTHAKREGESCSQKAK